MMPNKHAKPLAELNQNGIKLVNRWLRRTVDEISTGDRKPKVLDIGCGESPYVTKELRDRIEIHCCDRADYSKELGECFQERTFPWKAHGDACSPYDIIVFSAVLHELYRQRFISRLRPSIAESESLNLSTAEWFFKSLAESGLLRTNSRVIVAELYHRLFWPYAVLVKNQRWQLEKYHHADPPCSFPDPEQLIAVGDEQGFALSVFDEDYSLGKRKRNSLKRDSLKLNGTPEEIALHFSNRRFCCLVFDYRPEGAKLLKRIHSTGSVAASFRSRDHGFSGLNDALSRFQSSLEAWNEGRFQAHEIRREYDQILGGFSQCGQEANHQHIADPTAVFPTLAVQMAKTSAQLLEQLRVSDYSYHSFWLSLQSRVLAEGSRQHKERYLPSFPLQGRSGQPEQPALQVLDVAGGGPSYRWTATDDWTAIAFNHFGSSDAVESSILPFPQLSDALAPSLFRWFSGASGNRQKSPSRPESLTLFMGFDEWEDIEAPDKVIEIGSNAASLYRWRVPGEDLSGKHVFVVVDAASTLSSPHSVTMRSPVGPGEFLNYMTAGEYCGANGLFETHVMKSIASLYVDFMFLGAPLAREANRSEGEKTAALMEAVATYRSKWLSPDNSRFIDNKITYAALSKGWKPDHDRAILPYAYRERIEAACRAAEAHIKKHGSRLIPFSWSIFSSLDPMSPGREAPGNIMLFADTVLPRSVLTEQRRQADDAFRAIHQLEEEAIEVRRARAEGRELQLVDNLASFGHDAKHWASAITGILKTGWRNSTMVAGVFSDSLEARLSSYSRLATAFKSNVQIKDALEKEASKATSFIALRDLLLIEALPIFARICVDGRKWETLADRLWGNKESRKGHFERTFAELKLPPKWDTLIPLLTQARFSLVYSGPEFRVPLEIPGEGGQSTTPLLATCIRFILSELMTNAVKHQWSTKAPEILRADGIRFTLATEISNAELLLSASIAPASKPDINLSRFIGLQSMQLAARACGGKADEIPCIIDGIIRALPLPKYDMESRVLESKFRFPKEAFRYE